MLDLPPTAPLDEVRARLRELHAAYRERLPRVLRAARHRRTRRAMRGADPAIVLVPGVGMFSFGADKQTARVAGEFYLNAINVMRGAEAVSTYAPISEAEKFRIEYWALEEAKLRAAAEAQAAGHAGSPWSPAAGRGSAGPSRTGWPPRARAWSSPTGTAEAAGAGRPPSSAARTSPSRSPST